MSHNSQRRSGRVDELFRCLADQRRRTVIECLAEEPTPIALEALARRVGEREDDSSDEIAIALFHEHLPKMDDSGVIEIDRDRRTIREGDSFDTARSLLEAV